LLPRLLDAAVALVAVLALVRIAMVLPSRATRNDFAAYYASSRLALEGKDPYTTSLLPVYRSCGFALPSSAPTPTNPPPLIWLFSLVALLAPRPAFWTAAAVQAAGLAAILWLTRRLLRGRLGARGWLYVCTGVLASEAVFWHFCLSQVQLVLAAMMLAGYALLQKGRPNAACVAVTAAGLLKFFPFVLLPWFIWRGGQNARTRSLRAALSLAAIVVVVLATGPGWWLDFFRAPAKALLDWAIGPTYFNFCVSSFVTALGSLVHRSAPPGALLNWWRVGCAAGGLLIALCYLACRRARPDLEAEFCLLSLAMLAGSPMGWGYYFVFLIFPAAVAVARVGRRPARPRVLGLAGVLLLANGFNLQWLGCGIHDLEILFGYAPFYGLMGLILFFAGELARAPGGAGN